MDVSPDGAGLALLPSVLRTGRAMVTRHPDHSVVIVMPHPPRPLDTWHGLTLVSGGPEAS